MTEASRVFLIGCSATKAKATTPVPARELYKGKMFEGSLAYAEAQNGVIFIVSARHGLLRPERKLMPYDFTIHHLGGTREENVWGERLVDTLSTELALMGGTFDRIEVLMGDLYARPLRGPLRFRAGEHCQGYKLPEAVEPLKGLQIGERFAWLRAHTAKRAA